MPTYLAAVAGFILIHTGLSATRLRDVAVKRMGEWPYRAVYSLASIALLAAMIGAYGGLRYSPENRIYFIAPAWAGHIALLLIVLGLLLAIMGFLSPGPTLAGGEGLLARPEPARGALRLTRHPFLWGTSLWAAGHLIVNGDRVSLIFFGSLLLVALLGTRSIDRKCAKRNPAGWAPFLAKTSNLPFAALVQGRNRLAIGELAWRALIALALTAALYWAHPILFGAIPRPPA